MEMITPKKANPGVELITDLFSLFIFVLFGFFRIVILKALC